MNKLKFFSLASGSSGNCYYLGVDKYGILVDAGIEVKNIIERLKAKDIPLEKIMAVLVTHDHSDHIKSVGHLGEGDAHLPVYATAAVHEGILRSRYVKETLLQSKKIIEKEKPFTIRDFSITAFEVPHDSSDNVGYCIKYGNRTFVFLTDVGHITDTIRQYVQDIDYLLLESNYNKTKLADGPYPAFLKERVAGELGHLSNDEAAEFVASIYTPRLKNVWLCHLSNENNTPDLALYDVKAILQHNGIKIGKDLALTPLGRRTASEMFEFEVDI